MVDVSKIKTVFDEYFRVRGKFSITDEGIVNVVGSVTHAKLMSELPVKFGTVSGDFDFLRCGLTSLINAPTHVGGSFHIDGNNVTSLNGAPDHVGASFYCNKNNLTSLVGAPTYVGSDFFCNHNQLTTLEGAPDRVPMDFQCHFNELTNLAHAPTYVGNRFLCSDNPLESLDDLPKHIGQRLFLSYTAYLPLLGLVEYCISTNMKYDRILMYDVPKIVDEILAEYTLKGMEHLLDCGVALKDAGYAANSQM
jgi:hypothetical protein